MRRAGRIILAMLVLAPVGVAAQAVRGTLTVAGTGEPLAGVYVLLRDPGGVRVAGVLSGRDGRFYLAAPAAGRYTMETERLGYASYVSEPLDLVAGKVLERSAALAVEPVTIRGFEVEGAAGKTECDLPRKTAAATASLWKAARKALIVASWAAREQLVQYQILRYSGERDPNGRELLLEHREDRVREIRGSPWGIAEPARLVREGFVKPLPNGKADVYVPDADVLLSSEFVAVHCYSLVAHPQDSLLVGLAFKPIGRSRIITTIEGVLWLERRMLALRSIEYRYVPPRGRRYIGEAGGEVTFAHLASGLWIMRSWSAHIPILPPRVRSDDWSRIEDGATVLSARLADGREIWRDPSKAAVDSAAPAARDSPAPEVPPPGVSPRGDVGVRRTPRDPEPISPAALAAWSCRPRRVSTDQEVDAVGIVSNGAGAPLGGALVQLVWEEGGKLYTMDATTDAAGVYVACGIPVNTVVTLSASAAGHSTAHAESTASSRWLLVLDFVLRGGSAGTPEPERRRQD